MTASLSRALLISLAVLLMAALGAAWLVPPMLDWNRYRTDIAGFVSAQMGEDLAIAGQVRLSLLPEPQLSVGDVALTDRADGVSLRARELRLRVALLPLLAGRVDAREVVVRGLELRLPWPLGRLNAALRPPSWLASIAARVEDGRISLGGITARHVNATLGLAADTQSGGTEGQAPEGLTLSGSAEIGGLPWAVTLRSSDPGTADAVAIDIALSGQPQAAAPQNSAAPGASKPQGAEGIGAAFNGVLDGGGLHGRLSLHGPDLSALTQAAALPFRADGALTLSGDAAMMDTLSVDLAGVPARGALALHFGDGLSLDLALAASRVDLDAWLPALLRPGQDRLLPVDHANLDLSAEAGTLAGSLLRSLHVTAALDGSQITVNDLDATLPGDARLQLTGQLQRSPAPRFDGTAGLNAPALRTTLAWLGHAGVFDAQALPESVFTHADLRAALHAEGGAAPLIAASDLNGVIDDSHLQGRVDFHPAAHPEARPVMQARLDLDRLALDPFMPSSLKAMAGSTGALDLDLQAHVQTARIGARTISPLILDASFDQAHATLRRVDASLSGMHAALSGTVAADGRIADGKLDLTAQGRAMADLLRDLPEAAQPWVARLPALDLTVQANAAGPVEALALRFVVDFGDLHAELQPVLNLQAGSWAGKLALRHPGASRLITSLGFADPRPWLGEGSFSLSGMVSGMGMIWSPVKLSSDGFDLAAGQLRTSGALAWDATGPAPLLTGRLAAETLPLAIPALRSAEPLDVAALSGWQASVKLQAGQVLAGLMPLLGTVSTTVSLQSGVLRLDGLSATLDGGKLSGAIEVDASLAPPKISADLALTGTALEGPLFGLPVDVTGGVLDASAKLSASGFAPATLLATLGGTVQASLRDGALTGVDLGRIGPALAETDLRAALEGGSTAFDRLTVNATVQNGAVTLSDTLLDSTAGQITASGSVDLVGRSEAMRLGVSPPVSTPPAIGLRLSGDITAPARTPELADAVRWRAEHPAAVKPQETAPAQIAAPVAAAPAAQPAAPPAPAQPQPAPQPAQRRTRGP